MMITVKYKGYIPSQNKRYLPNGKGGRYKNPVHAAFEEDIGWEAISQNNIRNKPVFKGKLKVTLRMNLANEGKDADNCEKAIFDGFEGVLYKDDKKIKDHHTIVENCKDKPENFIMTVERL